MSRIRYIYFHGLKAVMLLSALVCCQLYADVEGIMSPQALVEKGLKAGAKYPGLASICSIDKPLRDMTKRRPASKSRTLTDEERQKRSEKAYIAPQQVFDNLYFVGNRSVASWVIETSDGLVLIDAMNSNRQAKEIIEKGILSLGLNPREIRYLIITHAHGDHYGGQEYLVNKYHPRVVMSEADWKELESPEPEIFNPKWGEAPTRDVSVEDGEILKLGDTKIELYVTPGHTLGTLSLIFPVFDDGVVHYAALWGGTGLNFGNKIDRLKMYSDSSLRFGQLAKSKSVDVFLSNHPRRDNSVLRLEQLAELEGNTQHPFIDTHAVGAFELLHNCSLAHLVKIQNYKLKQQSHFSKSN